MSNSLRPHGLYSPWNSPGQNTEVGSSSLLQGIFPTWESNPGLPHSRWIFNQLSHEGSPQLGAYKYLRIATLVAQWKRIRLPVQETQVHYLGRKDSWEKEMVTHCSILAWEILWTEGLVSHSSWGCKRVGHDLATKQQHTAKYLR